MELDEEKFGVIIEPNKDFIIQIEPGKYKGRIIQEGSFTKELEINQLVLSVTQRKVFSSEKTYDSFVKGIKNKIKRCKWNITRSKNLSIRDLTRSL